MKILGVDHIGIAVNNISEAKAFYEKGLGLSLDGTEDIPDRDLRIGFINAGDTKIELIESTSNRSAIAKFLASRGQGIHHICLKVDNIQQAIDQLIKEGYELIDDFPRTGAAGSKVAFLHPRAAGGVLIELKQLS
jgi:methylmalonyl-CoA/ethylmalonyl-CoA epimerase